MAETVGWEVDGYGVNLLQSCTAFIRSTAESEDGTLSGASAKGNALLMISGNCVLRTVSAGMRNDLKQAGSAVLQVDPSTTLYENNTSGTITVRLPNKDPGQMGGGLTVEP
jgi:hypothetical protein